MRETEAILNQIEKALIGKRPVAERVLAALLAGGHILLDDVPGVGKTSLALALSKAMGLRYRRIQFTPDVLPSDIVGFSLYDRLTGAFRYVPGVVNDANLVLGDEINRTSSKTQSALLEAMEEGCVTVDGETHPLERPFSVIATQNRVGTAGTQPLPQAQLDRFLVELSIGYPEPAQELAILRAHSGGDPGAAVEQVADTAALVTMQEAVRRVTMKDALLDYVTRLAAASRAHPSLSLGLSPRGSLALCRMTRAWAYLDGRDYAVPEDVLAVFPDVAAHRLLLSQGARLQRETPREVCDQLLGEVQLPLRDA